MTGELSIARGDIVWASMDPTKGREQAKDRPHLVLSVPALHDATEMVIAVPLTTAMRPWPTRVRVTERSFAICEQPRTLSFARIRKVEAGAAPPEVADEVARVVARLIGF
ncbi:type II toxin-antitoxin system PemK/MazF family toxin [Demequina silvatica]|uniref:type II toxin-antitoxin system PemK/MazF family toxin n=1 Tax=Demequina silvatica TaxID=1638988 RepID=UPI0007837E71|nr:type II toxin-antitoxin system PemK/MazF family toxin [Demequina silvatica]